MGFDYAGLIIPLRLGTLRYGLLILLIGFAPNSIRADDRPNFVVVLCDDLGYGDLGCFGSDEVHSPHIDRFATEGLKLTDCYAAAANCSPSRAGLMTGRVPYRVGIYNWIPFLSPMHLRESERTIATLLQEAGYDTCHVGKWHLNGWFNLPGQPQPGDHGFSHWFSTQNNALPSHRNPYNFVRDGIPVGEAAGYSSFLVVDEAVDWLTISRDSEKPFFLFVCFHEPHEPISTHPTYAGLYDYPDDPSRAAHHGNITQMDAAFGLLMDSLSQQGLAENTLVWFTSDNGPAITNWHPHGSTGIYREKKGHIYEGGIRVPGIIRWPGHVAAGSMSDVPVCGTDILPTLCELSGTPIPQDRILDGQSISTLLAGSEAMDRPRPLYWEFHVAQTPPRFALRDGDWKLLAGWDQPELPRGADWTAAHNTAIREARPIGFELYNMRNDPGEEHDVSADEPERLAELVHKLETMVAEVHAESPQWPEWTWPRYESDRIERPRYIER